MAAHVHCPKSTLEQKLGAVNVSQQSVEGTSKWLLFYSQDASSIVAAWYETLRRSDPARKLALLYLANHVLQEGRKKGKEWVDEFSKVIVKALRDFSSSADEKARRSADKMIKVWEDRRVFSSSHAKQMKEVMKAEQTSSFVVTRSGKIRPDVATEGSFAAVASARDVYAAAIKAFGDEAVARQKAIDKLRAVLAKQ
ncbi:hypothetical protein FOA52_004087 [Chlamydomonas sp. UWO 241]|nr:hypothetical protein FOA52_004087 [Chlamydomonas sp. UWO 241]